MNEKTVIVGVGVGLTPEDLARVERAEFIKVLVETSLADMTWPNGLAKALPLLPPGSRITFQW